MLCVIAKTDEDAREKLTALADLTQEFGIAPREIHGHITLVTYVGNDESGYMEKCKQALENLHSFPVTYEKTKVLPASSIIVASPAETSELLSIHQRLSVIDPLGLNEWTSDENWEAHTTLVHQPGADLEAIAKRMEEEFVPFEAEISCIEFSEVTEEGYTILDTIYLPTTGE